MNKEDWTKQLHDQLADFEESAPTDLWAGIEAQLAQPETSKPFSRIVPLWVKWTAAAVFVGILFGGVMMMWMSVGEKTMTMPEMALAEEDRMVDEQPRQETADGSANSLILPTSVLPARDYTASEELSQPTYAGDGKGASSRQVTEQVATEETEEKQMKGTESEGPASDILPQHELKRNGLMCRRKAAFGLYASNGFGNRQSTNGVVMSPWMAANYDYSRYLPAGARPQNDEIIYLNNHEERQKHYQPISIGLTLNYPISSKISLTTGVVYTRLRSDFSSIMDRYSMDKEQTLHYIGLPLSAQYRIWDYKNLHVYAVAGGQMDFNVKAEVMCQGVTQAIGKDRLQFSVHGAAGIQYDIIPRLGVYAEPGVKYHFDNGSPVSNFYKDKPANFNLQVGLRLNLGTR